MRSDTERLKDIQEAINKIEKYAIQGKAEFFANELIQSWILLQLQVIGEAARSMYPTSNNKLTISSNSDRATNRFNRITQKRLTAKDVCVSC